MFHSLNTSNANPPRTPSSAKKTSTADSDAAPPAPVRNERTFCEPEFEWPSPDASCPWQVLSVHPALQARVRTPAGAPSLSQDAQPPPKLPERPTAEPSLLKPTLDKSAEAAVVSTASWEEGKDYF